MTCRTTIAANLTWCTASAALFMAAVVLVMSPAAQATDEFLAFKDPPGQAIGPYATKALSSSLTELKSVLEKPHLWETRVGARSALDAPSSPTPQGLFTPRYSGSEITLFSTSEDESSVVSGLQVSLFSNPLTVSGVTPIALDTGDVSDDQAYNLGLNLGISRFQLGAAVSRFAGSDYEFGATGLDVDLRYLGDSWQTKLALSGVSSSEAGAATLGRGLGLVHDQSFAVEWGASYLLTPSLSLGGSLRFSGFKDGDIFGTGDTTATDSAVFLGTNIKF